MASRDRTRGIEGILTLSALLFVVIPCLISVYLARKPELPAGAVAVNEATAETLSRLLKIEPDIAARLIADRTRLGAFESADQPWEAPLFTTDEAERISSSGLAALSVSGTSLDRAAAGQLASAFAISTPAAGRLAAYRDSASVQALNIQRGYKSEVNSQAAHVRWERLIHTAPLLDPSTRNSGLKYLIVRTPAQVFRRFWLGSALLVLAMFLLPAWLRGSMRVGGDPYIVPLALLLCALGVAMLFSIKDPLRDRAVYEHHLKGIAIGLIAMVITARLNGITRSRIRSYAYVWVMCAGVLVLGLMLFGRGPDGVKLDLFGFQPIEIIKLLLVLFVSGYLSLRASLISDNSKPWKAQPDAGEARGARLTLPRKEDVGPLTVMFFGSLILFVVVKDLGPGLLLFATFVSLLYLTTARSGFVWMGAAMILLGGLLGYALHIGVFATRVDMWLHPFVNSHSNGMQLGQAYWAFASGGWRGSGMGLGMPALIPRSGSDLAFASWSEEAGLPGALLALALYASIVYRGIRIALRANNELDRTLAFGLTALFGLQTLLIVAGVTGLFPLTGISLPFLSYGNSALVAAFVTIGLLRGISAPPVGGIGRPDPGPDVRRAAQHWTLAFSVALIGVVGLCRLAPMTIWSADAIALHAIITPDADRVSRPHLNPRLLAIAGGIRRGTIYDRKGRVVATSRFDEARHTVGDEAARRLSDAGGRLYPFGGSLVHIVGYLDPAVGGPYGLERTLNDELRGYAHFQDLLPDYRSRHLPGYIPRRGRDVRLTIDAAVQRDAQALLWKSASALKDTVTGVRKDRGAFVLMDPHTGEVIAAASIPAFDPNNLTPGRFATLARSADAEREHSLVNRAIDGFYQPGSTLKVAAAAAALDRLPDAIRFEVTCNQVDPDLRWQAGGKSYAAVVHDDKGDPRFGPLNLAAAFRVSSNIYFANLAVAIGPDDLRTELADRFGFRRTPAKPAFEADLAEIGFGQGRMLASPLEMCRLAACVADDGTMQTPRFVAAITDPAGIDKPIAPQAAPPTRAMSQRTAAILRDMMRSVVTGGTATGVFNDVPYAVAGKTGTAQNRQFDRRPHSWFIGLAPYSEPRYAFACVIENGGYGKRVAAVVCANLLKRLP